MHWINIVTRKQNVLLVYTKMYGWCEKMKEVVGVGFNHMLMVSHQEATAYYVDKVELEKLFNILKNKILKDKPGRLGLAQTGVDYFQKVINCLHTITNQNLSLVSNKRLASHFKNYFEKQIKSLPFLILPTFVGDIFIKEMDSYLKNNVKVFLNKKTEKIPEYINIFATLEQESYATKAERDILKLAEEISKIKNCPDGKNVKKFIDFIKQNKVIYPKLIHHTKKWEWLPIQAEEKPYNINFFINEVRELIKTPDKILLRLSELNRHHKIIKKSKEKNLKVLKIDASHRRLISVFQDWVYLKDFRRAIISKERLYSRSLYIEIGKRFRLTGREVRFLSPDELIGALNKKTKLPPKKEIHDRMKSFILVRHAKKIQLITNKKSRELISRELPKLKNISSKTLKGISASPGRVTGRVKIIFGSSESSKIKIGNILIARQTTPDLLGAMKKASAIITDDGGVLCHAAIVSRELRLPCIVGTKNATKVLHDNDLVEVDANKGIIKILKN